MGHQDSTAFRLELSGDYYAAIAAIHKLARTLERGGSHYAQAAKIDAAGYELKFAAMAGMLQSAASDERAAADNLSARMKLNMRQLTKAAANDR